MTRGRASASSGSGIARQRRRVLVVDDDPTLTATLARVLTDAGYEVHTTSDPLTGLVAVEDLVPALVVVDWQLPFLGGAIFTRVLREVLDRPPPVLVLDDTSQPELALAEGAQAVLSTPPDEAAIVALVQQLIATSAAGT